MEVYIEDVLIENFFVTLLILLCINKVFKTKPKKIRVVLASLLGAIFALCQPIFSHFWELELIFKLACGVLIVWLNSGTNKLVAKYLTMLLFTTMYAGINLFVYYLAFGTINVLDNFATHILLVILFVSYYIINSCLGLMQKNFVVSSFVYGIKITNANGQFKDVAFLDSGNALIDPQTNSPVFIINFKLFSKLYKDITISDILIKNYKTQK